MPQMAPIFWLYLFIIFTVVFILFNILNYFNYSYKFNKSSTEIENKKTNYINWKW